MMFERAGDRFDNLRDLLRFPLPFSDLASELLGNPATQNGIGLYLLTDGAASLYVGKQHSDGHKSQMTRKIRMVVGGAYTVMANQNFLPIPQRLTGGYMFMDGLISLYLGRKGKFHTDKTTTALRLSRLALGAFLMLYL